MDSVLSPVFILGPHQWHMTPRQIWTGNDWVNIDSRQQNSISTSGPARSASSAFSPSPPLSRSAPRPETCVRINLGRLVETFQNKEFYLLYFVSAMVVRSLISAQETGSIHISSQQIAYIRSDNRYTATCWMKAIRGSVAPRENYAAFPLNLDCAQQQMDRWRYFN